MNPALLLSITYTDTRDLVRQLRAALLEHEEWITPKELRCRYGVESSAMTQRMKRWRHRGIEPEAKRGPTGRIILLKLTPELRAKMESMR